MFYSLDSLEIKKKKIKFIEYTPAFPVSGVVLNIRCVNRLPLYQMICKVMQNTPAPCIMYSTPVYPVCGGVLWKTPMSPPVSGGSPCMLWYVIENTHVSTCIWWFPLHVVVCYRKHPCLLLYVVVCYVKHPCLHLYLVVCTDISYPILLAVIEVYSDPYC